MNNMNTTLRPADYAVIVNADHAVVLVNGTLPCVPHNPPHFWQTCAPVNRAIQQRYGLNVSTVRCLLAGFSNGIEASVYLLEYQGGELPPAAAWVAPENFPRVLQPISAADVRQWLAWYAGHHPLRPAWYRPGFFADVVSSLPERLGGETPVRVEHLRSWERSWVARIVTNDGDLYYKAIPPMFAWEAALAAWLYTHYPDAVPVVLDAHPGRDYIMAAYNGQALNERPDLALWQEALARYAALQIDCIAHIEEIRALGVPERGLDWIEAHTDALLADKAALKTGMRPLTDEQIKSLRDLAPRLHDACKALAEFNIPLSLEHGDLWTGQNIAQPEGGFCFTDWSDCAITHPLFSLPFFMAEVDNELPGVASARQHLTDAYLDGWTRFASPARLREALAYAALLSPWYTALRYYVDILPNMEMRWENENMLTYNLRLLLRDA
jgi:hypothetical protein